MKNELINERTNERTNILHKVKNSSLISLLIDTTTLTIEGMWLSSLLSSSNYGVHLGVDHKIFA